MTWTGSGPTPAFTLTDDEVLALASNAWLDSNPPETFTASHLAYRKLQARAEDILNEQRASRR